MEKIIDKLDKLFQTNEGKDQYNFKYLDNWVQAMDIEEMGNKDNGFMEILKNNYFNVFYDRECFFKIYNAYVSNNLSKSDVERLVERLKDFMFIFKPSVLKNNSQKDISKLFSILNNNESLESEDIYKIMGKYLNNNKIINVDNIKIDEPEVKLSDKNTYNSLKSKNKEGLNTFIRTIEDKDKDLFNNLKDAINNK